MPLPTVDLGGSDPEFLSVLRNETRGTSLTVTGHGGWLQVSRPFPDLAITVNPSTMRQIRGHATEIVHTVDIGHVQRLWEGGEPLTSSNLDAGRIAASERLSELGKALVLGPEFYDNEVLRRIPGARPGLRVVAYCPETVRSSASELVTQVRWIRRKICLRALQRFVIHHELGHFFIDPGLRLDDSRFHDAFASHLAFGALRDQDSKDIAQAFSVLRQSADYNYYLLLNNFEGTKDILRKALAGNLDEARADFYSAVALQPLLGTDSRKLRVLGDIIGWPGFGSVKPLVACSGEVVGVANIRDGTVVASRIKIVDGFFPSTVRIFANEVGTVSKTSQRSGVIHVIPRARLDIRTLVRSNVGLGDIVAACKNRHPPEPSAGPAHPLFFNLCIPCRCEVFIITGEITADPDSVDFETARTAGCDRCGTVVEHKGDGIAFLAIDPNRNLAWNSRGGSSALERRIRATEKWLERGTPQPVLDRLLRR